VAGFQALAEAAILTRDPNWKFVAFQKKNVPATRTGTLGGKA
jgi:hypothetical protein